MSAEGGALDFDAYIRVADFNAAILDMQRRIIGLTGKVESETQKMDGAFSRLGGAAAAIFSVDFASRFISQVATVSGEISKLQVVLANSLGSDELAESALGMLKEYATTTPFQLNELTASYVKLVNQGFKPTRDELVKLGDLSSSTGKGFDQLAEAIIDAQTGEFERLKEFGIRASKQGDQVTFSFKGVQTQVDFTNEAIRSYIVSLGDLEGVAGANAKIAGEVEGKISNLKDTIASMYNSIGQNNKGAIVSAIDISAEVISHYQDFIDVAKVLVATYGAYKAALIAQIALQKASMLATQIQEWYQLGKNLGFATANQLMFNNAAKVNPYVALATAIVALGTALYVFSTRASGAKKAAEELRDAQDEAKAKAVEEKSKLEGLVRVIQDESSSRARKVEALNQLNELMPDTLGYISEEAVRTGRAKQMIDQYIASVERQVKIESIRSALSDSYKATGRAKRELGSYSTLDGVLEAAFPTLRANRMGQLASYANELDYQRELMKELKQLQEEELTTQAKAATVKPRSLSVIDAEIKKLKEEQEQLATTNAQFQSYSKQIAKLEAERSRIAGGGKGAGSTDKGRYKEELQKLLSELEAQRIGAMRSGFEREKAEINREYQERLTTIRQQEQSLLVEYNKGRGKKKGERGYVEELPLQAKQAVERLKELALAQKELKEQGALGLAGEVNLPDTSELDALLERTKTYEQKRLDVVGKGMLEVATLENAGMRQNAELRREQMSQELKELAAKHRQEGSSWAYLYDSIESWGKSSLQARLTRLREDLKETTLTAEEKLAVEKAISETEQKLAEKAPLEAVKLLNRRIASAKQRIAEAYGDANKIREAQREIDDSTAKKGAIMAETFGKVSGHLSSIASIVGQLNKGLGEAIELASGLTGAFSQIASGNYVSGAISLVGSVLTIVARQQAKDQAAYERQKKEEIDAINRQVEATNKLYEAQSKLLDRALGLDKLSQMNALWVSARQNIGKVREQLLQIQFPTDGSTRSPVKNRDALKLGLLNYGATLQDSLRSTNGRYSEAYSRYTQEQLKRVLTIDELLTANQSRIDEFYKQVEAGADVGDVDKYNEVLKLVEEYQKYAEQLEEIANKQKEILTGSTYDSVVDGLAKAFEDGIVSAEEFTSSFGELMKKQVMNTLKLQYLEKPLKDWYGSFAEASKDGLTKEEIEALRTDYLKFAENAKLGFENLNSVMAGAGVDLFGSSSAGGSGLSGAIKGMDQKTADLIAGQFNAMNVSLFNLAGVAKDQVRYLSEIAANTRYNVHLKEIRDILKSQGSNADPLRAKGL